MTGILTLRGRTIAVVGATRWHLLPPIEIRARNDPERRAVIALCRLLVCDDPLVPDIAATASPN